MINIIKNQSKTTLAFFLAIFLAVIFLTLITEKSFAQNESFYDLKVKGLDGELINFEQYRGHLVLIANIATNCGTTPQLEELQKLYEKYEKAGLIVLGIPSNDFMPTNPHDQATIKHICKERFGVTFPLSEAVELNGVNQHPIFRYLINTGKDETEGPVMFNFEKFLISKDGQIVGRYGSFTNAMSSRITREIESLLQKK